MVESDPTRHSGVIDRSEHIDRRADLRIRSVRAAATARPRAPVVDARQSSDVDGTCTTSITLECGVVGTSRIGYGRLLRGPHVLAALISEVVGPALVGADGSLIRRVRGDLEALLDYHGTLGFGSFAVAAVDIALWDAIGRYVDRPNWTLIGPYRDAIPAYATVGWLNVTDDELAATCRRAVDEGVRAVKVKVGGSSLERDLARIEATRTAVGSELPIMVDANQCFDRSEARRRADAYRDAGCAWFEEPIAADDVEGMTELTATSRIPIAAGENVYGRRDLARLISRRAVDIIQPDIRRAGGFTACLEIGQMASIHDIAYASHGSGVHLHALAAIPSAIYAEQGLVQDRIRPLIDGRIAMPSDPGFGSGD